MNIKKSAILLSSLLIVPLVTSCSSVDLPEEEQQMYVDYAVNAVVNHDKNYHDKLEKVAIETTTETVWYSENDKPIYSETSGSSGSDGSGEEQTTAFIVDTDLSGALGLKGFTVEYKDYLLCESYPEESDLAFVMKAVDGSNLVIVKLNVTNTTNKTRKLDVNSKGFKFKGIFNGKIKTNCQTTFLDDAFNTYSGSFKAKETKELFLVFETSKKTISEISTIKLEVTKDGNSNTIILKK